MGTLDDSAEGSSMAGGRPQRERVGRRPMRRQASWLPLACVLGVAAIVGALVLFGEDDSQSGAGRERPAPGAATDDVGRVDGEEQAPAEPSAEPREAAQPDPPDTGPRAPEPPPPARTEEPDVPPARSAGWRRDVARAVTAGESGDWRGAATALDRARRRGAPAGEIPRWLEQGLASYFASPALEVTAPRSGERVPRGGHVIVKGTFRSGRASDQVFVDGQRAAVMRGEFQLRVAVDATPGTTQHIEVTVVDRDEPGRQRARVGRDVFVSEGPAPPWAEARLKARKAAHASLRRRHRDAIDRALGWLAAHQSPSGAWEAAGYARWCDGEAYTPATPPQGLGKAIYDSGVSGLALWAFLRAGYTHRGEHPYAETVRKGLDYLKAAQVESGLFGPHVQGGVYNLAIATIALVEAYGLTGSAYWQEPAKEAVALCTLARNPYYAWRYGIKPGDNDTSVTGWMFEQYLLARDVVEAETKAGATPTFTIDPNTPDGVKAWLDKMVDSETGRYGYLTRGSGSARPQELVDRFPNDKTEAMTAVGLWARLEMGEDPRIAVNRRSAVLLSKLTPTWDGNDGSIDMYYWFMGTRALALMDGVYWDAWSPDLTRALVSNQRTDSDRCRYYGSWDAVGPWGQSDGGRVYATAISALALAVARGAR